MSLHKLTPALVWPIAHFTLLFVSCTWSFLISATPAALAGTPASALSAERWPAVPSFQQSPLATPALEPVATDTPTAVPAATATPTVVTPPTPDLAAAVIQVSPLAVAPGDAPLAGRETLPWIAAAVTLILVGGMVMAVSRNG